MNTLTSTELTIVMPCLNEAETLAACIHKAMSFLKSHQIEGEVLIADNGSSDGSQEIAEKLGAKVIHVKEKGYGAALSGGIKAAQGRYVIMGDSDDSYDFSNLMPLLKNFAKAMISCLEIVFAAEFKKGRCHSYIDI